MRAYIIGTGDQELLLRNEYIYSRKIVGWDNYPAVVHSGEQYIAEKPNLTVAIECSDLSDLER